MPLNEWTDSELDKYGLENIDIDRKPQLKLEALFEVLKIWSKPLLGVLFRGKVVVSKTELMRLAKIHPRKKVFEPKIMHGHPVHYSNMSRHLALP